MRVLHINSNYLTSRLHENLVDKLKSRNIENTIFMPIKEETKEAFLYESKHEIYSPVTFKNIDKYVFTNKQNKIYKKLKDTMEPGNFDMVHAHTLFTDGNIAYKIFKEFNKPYLVTVRGHTDIKNFFRIRLNLRGLGRRILKNARKIVFLSKSNRNELLDEYIKDEKLKENIMDKSIVLPNGIDDFWFENEGSPKTYDDNKSLKIVYVGKTMKLKNLLGTAKALNYLKSEKRINSTYTTIGNILEDSYAEQVRKTINVEYNEIGAVPKEDLIKYYRENDIFVMPSYSETFGLVYPEAMSQGLPVIYTKNQGFDGQFADGEVGYPVDANNPYDIAENILRIVNNYSAISKRALKNYKKFNWENISDEYLTIYKSIVN